jgi:hypothetical protein
LRREQAAPSIEALRIPGGVATALGHVRDELSAAATQNLVALDLYAGLAGGRYRGPKSDVDLAVVLEDASTERLSLLTPVLLAALRAARVKPWIAARSELGRLAHVFPTKFSTSRHLRFRVEPELRNLSLRAPSAGPEGCSRIAL